MHWLIFSVSKSVFLNFVMYVSYVYLITSITFNWDLKLVQITKKLANYIFLILLFESYVVALPVDSIERLKPNLQTASISYL